MRLFVALDLNELRGYFEGIQAQLRDERVHATWPRDFHLTLKFLGEVPEDKLEAVKERLGRVVFEPFEARVAELGWFTPRRLRTIWLAVRSPAIVELQTKIESALADLFGREKRFIPHLTLARIKAVRERSAYLSKLATVATEEKVVRLSSFQLIKSTLDRAGPSYEVLAEFKTKNL